MEQAWKTRSEKEGEYEEILTDLELNEISRSIPIGMIYDFEQIRDHLERIGWRVHPQWEKGMHDFNEIEEYLYKHGWRVVPK